VPTSPESAEILKNISEMISMVAGEGVSYCILQIKLKKSFV
jgi:hypothetical protein